MNDTAVTAETRDIVVEEVFPHAPDIIWRALTSGALMSRWIMAPTGFEPVAGRHFTFQTRPAGEWDGVIRCEVLQVVRNERFVYSWRSGHEGNAGYGAPLDTVVTWSLSPAAEGTRLRLVHAGFVLPRNDTAYGTMSDGWKTVVPRLGAIAGAPD